MTTYQVWDGPRSGGGQIREGGDFGLDAHEIEAETLAHAVEKMAEEWEMLEGELFFVCDPLSGQGRLIRVLKPQPTFERVVK